MGLVVKLLERLEPFLKHIEHEKRSCFLSHHPTLCVLALRQVPFFCYASTEVQNIYLAPMKRIVSITGKEIESTWLMNEIILKGKYVDRSMLEATTVRYRIIHFYKENVWQWWKPCFAFLALLSWLLGRPNTKRIFNELPLLFCLKKEMPNMARNELAVLLHAHPDGAEF